MKTYGTSAQARFVLLFHQMPMDSPRSDHWDLMLESDGALQTWALEAEPAVGQTVSAKKLADHRLAYLEIEGQISGGRGSVCRIGQGEFRGHLDLPNSRSGFQLELIGVFKSGLGPLEAIFHDLGNDDWVIAFQ